jgi:hypothetical protein
MAARATAKMHGRILVIDYKMGLATILKDCLQRVEQVVVARDGNSTLEDPYRFRPGIRGKARIYV